MRNLITLIIVLLPLTGSGQKLIETSFNNEDKAFGLAYIDADYNFILGINEGVYEDTLYEINHDLYKVGIAYLFEEVFLSPNDLLITASLCYNEYDVIKNLGAVTKTPKYTCEIGIRSNLFDSVYAGFQYDVIHRTGGFNLSIVIF